MRQGATVVKFAITAVTASLVLAASSLAASAKDPYLKQEEKEAKAHYKYQRKQAHEWEKYQRKQRREWQKNQREPFSY
jgi:hypothetical protein